MMYVIFLYRFTKVWIKIWASGLWKTKQSCRSSSLILFLMSRGGFVNPLNAAGLKLSDILLPNWGYPENIIELLIKFMRKSEKEPFCGSDGCMGLAGCVQQPALQLFCPHKKDIYKACSKCFLPTVEGLKCGCPEEEILPIPIPEFTLFFHIIYGVCANERGESRRSGGDHLQFQIE